MLSRKHQIGLIEMFFEEIMFDVCFEDAIFLLRPESYPEEIVDFDYPERIKIHYRPNNGFYDVSKITVCLRSIRHKDREVHYWKDLWFVGNEAVSYIFDSLSEDDDFDEHWTSLVGEFIMENDDEYCIKERTSWDKVIALLGNRTESIEEIDDNWKILHFENGTLFISYDSYVAAKVGGQLYFSSSFPLFFNSTASAICDWCDMMPSDIVDGLYTGEVIYIEPEMKMNYSRVYSADWIKVKE